MTRLDAALVDEIEEAIQGNREDLISLRRYLHAHPELSHAEYETTRTIADRLESIGFEVHVRDEGTGLYADLTPTDFDRKQDPTVAIRSDIDALPIEEQNDVPYASTNEGVMHACGHDAHMAIVSGAGLAFDEIRSRLPGRLRLIFQHAEEQNPGGARELVSFGAMDDVDAILGLHCDPSLETGKIGVRKGPFTAGFDDFEVTIIGRGGHGARPHECIDPIYVVTQVANALYQAIGQTFDARDPAVVSIGTIRGGDAPNTIPERAVIEGTIRTLYEDDRQEIEPMLKRIVGGVCMAHDAKYDLNVEYGAPPIYNEPAVVDRLVDVAEEMIGAENIREIPQPSMGSEDFSMYLQNTPGAMFRLGTASVGRRHLLHSPTFDVDERAIPLGSYMMARSALRVLTGLAEGSELGGSAETVEMAQQSRVPPRDESPEPASEEEVEAVD
ncbi:MAG: M20 family metallopeptidase [Bradymonadaceae bacterium]